MRVTSRMATWNGLEKFDGYSFKNYKTYPTDKVKLQYNRLVNLQLGGNQMLVCELRQKGVSVRYTPGVF